MKKNELIKLIDKKLNAGYLKWKILKFLGKYKKGEYYSIEDEYKRLVDECFDKKSDSLIYNPSLRVVKIKDIKRGNQNEKE